MRRRIAPGTVLTIGLLLASVAFVMWAVQSTAFERGPLHREAAAVLSESPARNAMHARLTAAIAGAAPVTPGNADALATGALDQPEFVTAFAGALDRVQDHVVDGATGAITLDPTPVGEAVRAAAATDPQLAVAVARLQPLVVQIPEDEIPDLAQWVDVLEAALRALAFFAVLLITYGVLGDEHRVWAMGRIGRWAIVVGILTLTMFWLVPRVLLRPLGGWIAVGGAVAGAGDQLIPVSLALVAFGAVAVIGAHRWETNDRKRTLSTIPHAPSRSTTPWESPV